MKDDKKQEIIATLKESISALKETVSMIESDNFQRASTLIDKAVSPTNKVKISLVMHRK